MPDVRDTMTMTATDEPVRGPRDVAHRRMLALAVAVPTDYDDYGGTVERWKDDAEPYPDCSMSCRWGIYLGADWLVCGKVGGPRQGLLTFEHQAGHGCFEPAGDRDERLAIRVEGHLQFSADQA